MPGHRSNHNQGGGGAKCFNFLLMFFTIMFLIDSSVDIKKEKLARD